ncbi:MAG: HD domain-containing protein [Spirochaetales bacterium]|nr:HD domain-containing protein [Spirochaetales bacterium]
MKDKLLQELEKHFGNDTRRIAHAKKVLFYAERLLEKLPGDPRIVVPSAILHDVGIKIGEEKYGSNAGIYQEREGPPVARRILEALGMGPREIDEICDIIGHHHSPGKNESLNFRILYDADGIVNLAETAEKNSLADLLRIIEKHFLTEEGKMIAADLYAGKAAEGG